MSTICMMMLNCRRRFLFTFPSRVSLRLWSFRKGQYFTSPRTRVLSSWGRLQQKQSSLQSAGYKSLRFLKDSVQKNTKDPNEYPKSYILKEFGWNEFNKIGNLHPHCHAGNLQLAACLILHDAWDYEGGKTSVITRGLTLKFLPAYHTTNFVSRPVKYDSYFAYLGRTSMYLAIDLQDAESGVPYMSGIVQCMMFDGAKRASLPVAPALVQNYGHRTTLKTSPQRHQFSPFKPGKDNVFTLQRTVEWSDADYHGHLNIAFHLRYMYDVASSAVLAGYLPSFRQELIHYKLEKFAADYMREAPQGQEVEVHCWELDDNPGTIHFEFQIGDHTVNRSFLTFDL